MEENNLIVKFDKPYNFEGTEYTEIDLSAIENLSTKDLVEADKRFIGTGQVAAMNEISTGYCCIIASIATKKPIEFFENTPAKEGIKIKSVISNFFLD